MALTVTMPQLGESVTEGTIARWLKQPGEFVAKYESIAEVITDKVNAEIPAPADGSMGEHIAHEGDVVAVGQPICTIEATEQAQQRSAWAQPTLDAGEANQGQAEGQGTPAEAAGGGQGAPAPQPEAPSPQPQPAPQPVAGGAPQQAAAPAAQESVPAPRAGAVGVASREDAAPATSAPVDTSGYHLTPAVRMLIREHGVDLTQIQGSGLGGRITKKDVLEHVQQRDSGGLRQPAPAAPGTAPAAPAPAPQPAPAPVSLGEGDTLVPLTPMRRAIAEHMVRSKQTSPHAWLMVEVDMTKVVRLRNARKEEFQRRNGVSLTFLPFIAKATCETLHEFPVVNSVWSDEGIVEKRDIHLGIAVALEDNLVVPVIRNADRLSVSGLATSMSEIAERARANKLKLEEIQGGTFTLNNTGALGTVLTQPIINQPQAGILATDAIVKRPVVVEGDAIAVRSMMNLCLSFDHRIIDGLQAARFVRAIKQKLESIDESTAV